MNRKAIFFDIDGTLINRSGGPFPDDLAAMEEAVSAGHLLFVNTGRSFANIPEPITGLTFWSGIAAGGGAHILMKDAAEKTGHKTVYHKWVDDDGYLNEICAWYLENKRLLVLEGEKDCYILNPSDRRFCVRPVKIITRFDEFTRQYSDDFVTKLTIAEKPDAYERELLEKFFTVNVFPDYGEAIIKGENKAKAIKIILENSGIKPEDSIAVGDSVNDLDMIRYAGLGVAMGNACDELKKAASAITGNCGEGGVAQMLKRHVLMRSGF